MKILYYVHDPMCSWCYGFSSTLTRLIAGLPGDVEFRRLLGGLAADSDEPMTAETRAHVRSNWSRIEKAIPGVSFNHDFWIQCAPRRATYMSCRAVITAREQGEQYDMQMTTAIQQAYYQQARNPSDVETLVDLAVQLGLDTEQFRQRLQSDDVEGILQQEIMLSAEMGVASYPSLRLDLDGSVWPVSIDYNDAGNMLEQIDILS